MVAFFAAGLLENLRELVFLSVESKFVDPKISCNFVQFSINKIDEFSRLDPEARRVVS
jgi:hypothetical protein